LESQGFVDLSSAAAHYWGRASLLVSEHPYCAVTDAVGNFSLADVPPGRYEVVGRLPNWHIAKGDFDPETMMLSRLYFGPPVEACAWVSIETGCETLTELTANTTQFTPAVGRARP
jgi:hypothetical protein